MVCSYLPRCRVPARGTSEELSLLSFRYLSPRYVIMAPLSYMTKSSSSIRTGIFPNGLYCFTCGLCGIAGTCSYDTPSSSSIQSTRKVRKEAPPRMVGSPFLVSVDTVAFIYRVNTLGERGGNDSEVGRIAIGCAIVKHRVRISFRSF